MNRRTKRKLDGLFKRCTCRRWNDCAHSWWVAFKPEGQPQIRKSLNTKSRAEAKNLRDSLRVTPIKETSPETLDEKGKFYAEHVQPIFERRCVRCHGAEKQKGDYRLDVPTVALAGGESGKAAIQPGNPMASELVRLILLPPGDDEIMPPDGKEPVTAEEALTIIRWIQAGATFPIARTASVKQ